MIPQSHTAGLLTVLMFFTSSVAAPVFAQDNPQATQSNPPAAISQAALDQQLQSLINLHGMLGDPATGRGLRQITPDEDSLVKLGQILFFSQTLSGGYDTACASCHHPDFGMGDGLSLGVGVVPENRSAIGPGRMIDQNRDQDPAADGGPNMFRNSLTTMNSSLLDRVLLLDGRVQVMGTEVTAGGHGQDINTPESGIRADADPVSGLVEFQAKGALVTDNEMRGYFYTEYSTAAEYRQHLIQRLRGEIDSEYNTLPDAADNWLQLFRNGFNDSAGSSEQLINMPNIQKAMGAYMDSQIFIDSPWNNYVKGDVSAISLEAKRGARLFLENKETGGLGCAQCHRGDTFTDEAFYNVGFPQIGRGFRRAGTTDMGRWLETGDNEDISAFRTLSLLNVALTGPWGHAGTFETLEELLRYHANPRSAVNEYNFSLSTLSQFIGNDIFYPDAQGNTRKAIAQSSFNSAEALLPMRDLSDNEVFFLSAFLNSLTDQCADDPRCLGKWAPAITEDPDGHLLVRDVSLATPALSGVSSADTYPEFLTLDFPVNTALETFSDVQSCTNNIQTAVNSGRKIFTQQSDTEFGLNAPHGFGSSTWFRSQSSLEATMSAGGVTSVYLDDDCWPDLIFTGGELSGMKLYRNAEGLHFSDISAVLLDNIEHEFSNIAVADLNGDYRRELLFGNLYGQTIPVYGKTADSTYQKIVNIPIARPTFGISFAPLDDTGYLYFYLAHWSGGSGQNGTSPALWKNEAGSVLRPWDIQAGTSSNDIDQYFNFTPIFADLTGDNKLDLLIASDFDSTSTLRNISTQTSQPLFQDETDYDVITDENGMGSTLLDLDNDGVLEWFVSSIFTDKTKSELIRDTSFAKVNNMIPINWGVTGNRLYRNTSTPEHLALEDITDQAGVRLGHWGWGACAADFNNDGFIDLYQVNGYGYMTDDILNKDDQLTSQNILSELTQNSFQNKPGLLYINQGDGTFLDEAESWSLDIPSEGRGLSCFDYNRDGDIDIVVFDHSTGLQFFENHIGNDDGQHFLNIRLVGTSPNTDAIGAQVTVSANVGAGHGQQTQLRLSQANSNYNSQTIPDLHFGVGEADIIDEITVEWLNGDTLTCNKVSANQFLVIDQRKGEAACSF